LSRRFAVCFTCIAARSGSKSTKATLQDVDWRTVMSLGAILLIILILALVGAFPAWGYHNYGYYPSGGVGLLLLIVIVLLVLGRI
jgi:hypothetical protein